MPGTLYLFAYDICAPKRLQRVHRILKERALALQYSVFVLEGTERDKQAAMRAVESVVNPDEDDVRVYTLPANVEVQALGAADPLPKGVLLVGAGGALAVRERPDGRQKQQKKGSDNFARRQGDLFTYCAGTHKSA